MVAAAVEIASGVPVVCVRRDGVGVAVPAVVASVASAAVVLGVVAVPGVAAASAVSAGVAVLLLVAVFAAGAFVLVPPSASACACCSAVA